MSFAESQRKAGRRFQNLVTSTGGLAVPGKLTLNANAAGSLAHLGAENEASLGTIVRGGAAGAAFASGATAGEVTLSRDAETTTVSLKTRIDASETLPVEPWGGKFLQAPARLRNMMYIPELGRYVAAGDNALQSSDDGETWTSREVPAPRVWNKMAWSAERGLLVVGAQFEAASPMLLTSTDGITYSTRTTPNARSINGIAYGAGTFVTVSSTGDPMTSTDGITWTTRTQPSAQVWCDLVWADSLGVFVALSTSGPNHVMTSPDGINWTLRPTPAQSGGGLAPWRALAWSPAQGVLVAVASGGAGRVMTSEDGATWTLRTVPLAQWTAVTWADGIGLFVAVARKADTAGDALMMTSPDGVTWTTRSSSQVDAYKSVSWGNGRLLAATEITQGGYLDEGERTWHGSLANGTNWGMAWSPELNILATSDRKYSTDGGVTWEVGTGTSGSGYHFKWVPELGIFVLPVGTTSSNQLLQSQDGRSWSLFATLPVSSTWSDIAWSPERSTFVVIGPQIAVSTTAGTSWQTITPINESKYKQIIWVTELQSFFYSSYLDDFVARSTDGISWESVAVPGTSVLNGVAWSPELNTLVVTENNGKIAYSTTGGDSWAALSLAGSWRAAAWSPELRFFVAVGQSSAPIAYSTDGINWFTETAPGLGNQYSVIWIPELARFVRSTNSGVTTRLEYTGRMRDLYLQDGTAPRPQWVQRSGRPSAIGAAWSSEHDVLVVSNYNTSYVSRSTTGGESWETVSLPLITTWWGAAWAPEISTFVIVSSSTTTPVARSTTFGLSWTTHTKDIDMLRVKWLPTGPSSGKFIGYGSSVRAESSDGGITWTAISGLLIDDFDYSPELSVSVGVRNSVMFRSTDAWASWETQSVSGFWTAVVWMPERNRFLATATSTLAYSDDGGLTWTTRAMTTTAQPYRHLVWAPEIGTVFGGSGTAVSAGGIRSSRIGYGSADGLTWVTDARFPSPFSAESVYGAVWLGKAYYRFVAAVYGPSSVYLQTYPEANPTGVALRSWFFDPAAPPAWSNESRSGEWWGAVYAKELGMFVIGNSSSVIARSTTGGASWINSSVPGVWYAVTWAPEINTFVAVGDAGKIAYSTTGASSWVASTYGSVTYWGVAWAPEIRTFVAVSSNGAYARSTDNGVSWMTVARANNWYGITWAPEIRTFVKVASAGTNRISYSTTGGETWADASYTEATLYGVTWAPELSRFVAVGSTAVRISTTGGVSWTTGTMPSGFWYRVLWAPEMRAFVAVGGLGVAAFSTTGGETWVQFNRAGGNSFGVAWAPEIATLLVVHRSSAINRMIIPYTSTTPTYPSYALTAKPKGAALRRFDFDPAAPPAWSNEVLSGAWYGAVYAKELGMFVLIDAGNAVIARSTTGGASWINSSVSGSWRAITWAPEINTFVAVGGPGKFAYSTTGATSWVVSTIGSTTYFGVAWAPEIRTFVAVSSSDQYARSTDNGVTWQTIYRNNDWFDITWAPEIRTFVKVASSGTSPRISYSTTGGETWADATVTATLYGVAWSPEMARFVAVGVGAVQISTTGGVSWTTSTAIDAGSWLRVTWVPEIRAFVAMGNTGRAAFSTTGGESWVQPFRPTTAAAYGLAWAPDSGTLLVPTVSNTFQRMIIPSSSAATTLALTSGSRSVVTVNADGIVSETSSPFTGSHEVGMVGSISSLLDGRIAVTTGKMRAITLSDSRPEAALATLPCDRRVYGVFNSRGGGRPMVNAVGEGGMWVCDAGGNLATGDYVCSSAVAGYGMRQPESGMRNYTVAKVMEPCRFDEAATKGTHDVRYLAWAEEYDRMAITNATQAPQPTEEEVTAPASTEGEATTPATTEGEATAPATTEGEATAPVTTEGEATAPATTEGEATATATTEGEATAPATTEGEATAPATTEGEATAPATTEGEATAPATTEGEAATEPTTEGEATAEPTAEGEELTAPASEPVTVVKRPEPPPIVLSWPACAEDNVVRISREEYERRIAAGLDAFRAVFVGCTYHCG